MPQKTFNISFTKNPIKILNNNKKPLILPNKTKILKSQIVTSKSQVVKLVNTIVLETIT